MASGGVLSRPLIDGEYADGVARCGRGSNHDAYTPRALFLGPDFLPGGGGGLALALDDVCLALRQRGWIVVRPSLGSGRADGESAAPYLLPRLLTDGLRSTAVIRLYSRLPTRFRRWAVNLLRPAHFFERQSAILAVAESQLRSGDYDVVLVCSVPIHQSPGLLRLATSLHRCVVAISLTALPDEFRYKWLWATVRVVARMRTRRICHSSLGRPVEPEALRHAVFASTAWRRAALRAGLLPERASTIYFGVTVPPSVVRGAWRNRLLWVGRLSPEKGLHELLRALPAVRARVPGITLTAIAAQGPRSYDRLINRLLVDNASSVSLLSARPRSALQDVYGEHDALVFYSVFEEPVALVVLEAFGAGLPVIATRPRTREGPLREEETCLCFDSTEPDSLARAVERLRADEALRARLTHRAREVVLSEFSLDRMGATYDALLRDLIHSRR